MEMAKFKDHLREQIEFQAEWREEKAAEYPEDERNARSARNLRALAGQFVQLPEDHETLEEVWHELYGPGAPEDLTATIEAERELLRSYGFYGEESQDPETFLKAYLEAVESAGS